MQLQILNQFFCQKKQVYFPSGHEIFVDFISQIHAAVDSFAYGWQSVKTADHLIYFGDVNFLQIRKQIRNFRKAPDTDIEITRLMIIDFHIEVLYLVEIYT